MKKMLVPCLLVAFFAAALHAADDPYAALRLYDGSWEARSGEKADRLTDQCALVGTYFVCQQTVNGKVGALLVFVPAAAPGQFYTQNILPEGWATGRGEVRIDGNHWTYSSIGPSTSSPGRTASTRSRRSRRTASTGRS